MIDFRRRVLTGFLNLTGSIDFVYNYIFFFSTVKIVQQIDQHSHFTLACYVKGISSKNVTIKGRYILQWHVM